MRAVVVHRHRPPGEALAIEEIDTPTPGERDVLVRIEAAALNRRDLRHTAVEPWLGRRGAGRHEPETAILGSDLAGRVEAVGSRVTRFAPGDEVYAWVDSGAFAEYIALPETALEHKPGNLTLEQAAAVPFAAQTALQGLLDHAGVRPEQKVLINGASGGVGTFAVQIARAFGADVTAVCATKDLDRIRVLGAHHAIDYTRVDFTRQGRRYDVILDVAARTPVSRIRRALEPDGSYVLVGKPAGGWIGGLRRSLALRVHSGLANGTLVSFSSVPDVEGLAFLTDMIEHWKIVPVVDRVYALGDILDAMRYLEGGHVRGKVVIKVAASRAGSPRRHHRTFSA
jgi:NADPH:quinone reductase-like Zn-dependent oxidoreductase